MRKVPALFVACLLLWTVPASARDLVELPAGQVYELKIDEDVERVWISLNSPQGGTLDGLAVGGTPVDVALGNRHESSLGGAFTATLKPPSKDQSPGIELALQMATLPEPGTYDVQLQLTQGQERQLLKLQIIIPEAQLRALTPPLIDRVIGVTGRSEISSTPLVLSETGKRSRVTGLAVQPITPGTLGDKTVTGHLSFSPGGEPPIIIPPGGTKTIAYALGGDFPIGTVKGSVELSSPQLKAPLAVSYEVRTRRTKAWIFLLLAAGLAVGFLTRNWLVYQVSLNEKRVELESLRLRLEGELRRIPDAQLHRELNATLDSLAQARDEEVKELSEKVVAADQRFSQARADLEKRRAEEESKLATLKQLLEAAWSVPDEVGNLLRGAQEGLARSQKALQDHDVVTASQERDQLERGLGKDVVARLGSWQTSVEDLTQQLADAPLPLRKVDQPAVTSQLEQIRGAVGQLPLDTVHPDLKAILEKTHQARSLLRGTAPRLRSHVRRVLQGVRDALVGTTIPLTGLDQALEGWALAHGDSIEQELSWIIGQSRGLDQTLKEATVKPLGDNPGDDEKALIAERRYEELAALVAKRQAAAKRLPMGTVPFGNQVEPPPPVAARAHAAPAPAVTFTDLPGALPQLPTLMARVIHLFREQPLSAREGYARAFGALLRAKAARTLLAGIGILWVGYLLFEGTFIGTAQDLATVFIWGFTIDVSVDALVDVMSKSFRKG
jgi:hypothetical protein